ncbi:MAG: galactokinase [Kiritimatiellae bacterium]|nr:galactokinase [Kiritimatiellia bacterium]
MAWTALRDKVAAAHEKRFNAAPAILAFAPGRIEILGNHTDYNEGLALSAAIEQGVCFALSPSGEQRCRVFAADFNEEAALEVRSPQLSYETPWLNYTAGVLSRLQKHGDFDVAFNATLGGDMPVGSGLSSSAAVAVASATGLASFYGVKLPPLELAKLCQEAESEFAGLRCGLLDQVTSLFGAADRVVFTDFRALSVKQAPLPLEVTFLVGHTEVQRELVNSEYNQRRAQCEEATRFFRKKIGPRVTALRDVTLTDVQCHTPELGSLLARRAAHIISENQRVLQAVRLLTRGEMSLFGSLMFASHESSMQSFENSSPDQDFLVVLARRQDGVLGARLSGGGFGGNVLILVETDAAEAVSKAIEAGYQEMQGKPLSVWTVRPSAGARVVTSA